MPTWTVLEVTSLGITGGFLFFTKPVLGALSGKTEFKSLFGLKSLLLVAYRSIDNQK